MSTRKQTKVKLPELELVAGAAGLSITDMYELTGVSRNTISAILKGQEVRVGTVSKLLKRLKDKGVDVRDAENAFLGRRSKVLLQRAAGLTVVPSSISDQDSSRSAFQDARIQAQLLERQIARLLMNIQSKDLEFDELDRRNLKRHMTRIMEDLKEVWDLLDDFGVTQKSP